MCNSWNDSCSGSSGIVMVVVVVVVVVVANINTGMSWVRRQGHTPPVQQPRKEGVWLHACLHAGSSCYVLVVPPVFAGVQGRWSLDPSIGLSGHTTPESVHAVGGVGMTGGSGGCVLGMLAHLRHSHCQPVAEPQCLPLSHPGKSYNPAPERHNHTKRATTHTHARTHARTSSTIYNSDLVTPL